MSKNFSLNNRGQRNKSDFYQTPYSLTNELLNHEDFNYAKYVYEPACGDGAIKKILYERWSGGTVAGTDISTGFDFLEHLKNEPDHHPNYIITNPPFSLALEFIEISKKVATEKIAMLLPLNYLHGQKRYETLWKDRCFPLKKIYVLSRYPMLTNSIRKDGKFTTGMQVYAWYIWDKTYIGEPIIDWIDINKYVLNKKDLK